ncbi:MAG: Zn peptidase, partial [Bacillota bacterium]
SNYIDIAETFCNALTAEILVPQDLFQIQFKAEAGTPDKRFRALAEHFSCSIVVIARRALDFGYIDQGQYYKIASEAKSDFDQLKKKRKQEKGKGDFYKTNAIRMDHRFLLALDMSLREGKTLQTDAFRLTNTNRVTFNNLVSEIRDKRS